MGVCLAGHGWCSRQPSERAARAILLLILSLLGQHLGDVLVLPILEDLEEELHAGGGQQTDIRDERRDGTCGVSAAAEAEQEDLVALLPVVADEAVALADVGRDRGARCAADDAVLEPAIGADARVVEDDLRGRGLGVLGRDDVGVEGAADARYVRGEGDVVAGEEGGEEVAEGILGGRVGVAVLVRC